MMKYILSCIAIFMTVLMVACSPAESYSSVTTTVLTSSTASSKEDSSSDSSLQANTVNSNTNSSNISSTQKGELVNRSSKPLIAINGVSLSHYKVIYKADDAYAKYAAENFQMYVSQNFNNGILIYPDTTPKGDYEILLGDTNRGVMVENETSVTGNKYAVKCVGKSIVLKAKGYMIGGAVRGLLDICESATKANNILYTNISGNAVIKEYEYKDPKGVLLYIGDGMGKNHVNWVVSEGITNFCANDMPNKGEVITYSLSSSKNPTTTDSAAGGTALATGYKTRNGYLGLDYDGKYVKNIRELAASKGANTAVITTDPINDATPGAFLVHIDDRYKKDQISVLINSLISKKEVTVARGSLGNNLCAFSQNTLEKISSGKKRFFMMLEEARIDDGSEQNNCDVLFNAMKTFNEAIANAMQFTLVRGDVVLIVTADHETGSVAMNNGKYNFTTKLHSKENVPIYAMGKGTETLTQKPLNNVLVPRFIAKIFGNNYFGDMSITE